MAIRVLHVTTGLESGGAEMMLYKLLSKMDRRRFECSVVSLTDSGPILGEKIRQLGVPLDVLGFKRGVPNPIMIPAVAGRIRALKPDLVQSWMYHADLIGTLALKLTREYPLVWTVHSAMMDPSRIKRQTRLVVNLTRKLATRGPQRIIYCSPAAATSHEQMGYPADRTDVISNGIDTGEFVRDREARTSLRRELHLADNAPLIGLIARFDPEKDHQTFFQAAIQISRSRPDVHFLLCGAGVSKLNTALYRALDMGNLLPRTHLLGLRRDVPRITAALDIAVCCSVSESFGLTLAEAMACGVSCVTTDLPGPVSVVGDSGWVVPIGNPERLAAAWQEMLDLPANKREEWAKRARERITTQFSLETMVEAYQRVYSELMDTSAGRNTPAR